MKLSPTPSHIPASIPVRSQLPIRFSLPAFLTAGLAVAVLFATAQRAQGQDTAQPAAPAAAQSASQKGKSHKPAAETKEEKKDNKVVESKDTKKEDKKALKDNPLLGQDSKLPDKALYDKAQDAIKHGKFDVGRLDLQTLLNAYPDSQYMMAAKLAIADSWYKEGGTAALTQAEQEYRDFITFFPNSPDAAEAQMRIGDIYFRQMDKPDRDDTNTVHAEEEYRRMLQQFPDSVLVPQARNKLREVQEVLAAREATTAAFYATHANWPATIARYETVIETYPLYSHMDDVLIGLGDAYEAEAAITRAMRIPPTATKEQQEMIEAGKARMLKIDEDQAAAAYRKVVLEHYASPHVEDAKDRLVGMGLPIPTPTKEQIAASEALENSRGQYNLSNRVMLMFLHQADTVQAATIGDPPLEDPKPVSAATIVRQAQSDYINSMTAPAKKVSQVAAAPAAAPETTASAAPGAAPAAAPKLEDVPTNTDAASSTSSTNVPIVSSPSSTRATTAVGGLEVVQPSADSPAPTSTTFPGTEAAPAGTNPAPTAADNTPAATAASTPANNGGIGPVGPADAAPLPPVEKPDVAPAPINDAAGNPQPAAALPAASGKNPKPELDKQDDSSSKHKKKKGLGKLNPF